MKTKKGFMLREVAGNSVVVAVGEASRSFNGLITLNDTAVFLWNLLSKGATEEELVDAIKSEYIVEADVAKNDVAAFVEKCKKAGLIEE